MIRRACVAVKYANGQQPTNTRAATRVVRSQPTVVPSSDRVANPIAAA